MTPNILNSVLSLTEGAANFMNDPTFFQGIYQFINNVNLNNNILGDC